VLNNDEVSDNKRKQKNNEIFRETRMIPRRIILHCSATPDYVIDNRYFDRFGAVQIDDWHRQKGWKKIGYHFVIRRTGKIESGRKYDLYDCEVGAHCENQNHDSIGVCWIGTREPTKMQYEALQELAIKFRKDFGLTKNHWFGHNEFSKKECPGISMDFVKNLFDF
jgi:N-acetylmuramoyl-L-alanine amidase